MLMEDLGVSRPVDVVRNWSRLPVLKNRRDPSIRRDLGWASDDIVVLHAGNMGAKQGLEHVVLASRIAESSGSKVRFVLLGDGNQRAALEAMGGNSRLQFIDPVGEDDFQAVLASADVLLVNERPGLTEMSVPSKLTTYFATGLPVVAAVDPRSTTHDEMVAAGAGPCVPADNPLALVHAIEDLAADPEGARALGRSGRKYRERVLSESAAIESFEAVLIAASKKQFAHPMETITRETSSASPVAYAA
jgi:glycosyltransferase involved in cell wall biosynthesis